MTTFARCTALPGPILEIVTLPADLTLSACFAAAVAAFFHPCPATAVVGEILAADGTVSAAPAAAPTPAQLVAYAQAKQAAIASGGVSVNVAASGASPVMLEAATDTDGKTNLSGLLQASSLNPSGSFNWVQGTSPIALTQTQVQTLAVGVYAFVQLTWTVLGEVLAGITAGTITTTAQIDDPTTVGLPEWPVNS